MAFTEKSKTAYHTVKSQAKPSTTRGPDPFSTNSHPPTGKMQNTSTRTEMSSLPTYRPHYIEPTNKNKILSRPSSGPPETVFVWSNSAFSQGAETTTSTRLSLPKTSSSHSKAHTATSSHKPEKLDAVATTNPSENPSRKPISLISTQVHVPTSRRISPTSTVKTIPSNRATDGGSVTTKEGATLPASLKTLADESVISSAQISSRMPESSFSTLRNLSAKNINVNTKPQSPHVHTGKSEVPFGGDPPSRAPTETIQQQIQPQIQQQKPPPQQRQLNVSSGKSEVPYGGDPPSRAPTNWSNNFKNSGTLSSNNAVNHNISQLSNANPVNKSKVPDKNKSVIRKSIVGPMAEQFIVSTKPRPKQIFSTVTQLPPPMTIADNTAVVNTKIRTTDLPSDMRKIPQVETRKEQQRSPSPKPHGNEILPGDPTPEELKNTQYYPWGEPPYNAENLIKILQPDPPPAQPPQLDDQTQKKRDEADEEITSNNNSNSPWGQSASRREVRYIPRKQTQSRRRFSSTTSSSKKYKKHRRKSSSSQQQDEVVVVQAKVEEIPHPGQEPPIVDPKSGRKSIVNTIYDHQSNNPVDNSNPSPRNEQQFSNSNPNPNAVAEQHKTPNPNPIDSEQETRNVWENSVKLKQKEQSKIVQHPNQNPGNNNTNNNDTRRYDTALNYDAQKGVNPAVYTALHAKTAKSKMTNSQQQQQQQQQKNKVHFSAVPQQQQQHNFVTNMAIVGKGVIPEKPGSFAPYSGDAHSRAQTVVNQPVPGVKKSLVNSSSSNRKEQRKQSFTPSGYEIEAYNYDANDPNQVGHPDSRIAERQTAALVSRESLIASPRYSDYEVNNNSNLVPTAAVPQEINNESSQKQAYRNPVGPSNVVPIPPVGNPTHIGRGSQFWYREGHAPSQGQASITWYPISVIAQNWITNVYFSDLDVQSVPSFKYASRVEEVHFDGVISQRTFLALLSRLKELKTLEVHLSTLHHLNLDQYSVESIELPKLKSLEISSRGFTEADTNTYNMSKVIANSILLLNLEYPILTYIGVSIPYVQSLERRLMHAIWQCILHHRKTLLTFNIECAFQDNMNGRAPRPYIDPAIIEMDITGANEVRLSSFHMFYWTRLGGTEFWRRFLKSQEKLEYLQFWCEGPLYYKFPYDVVKKNYYQLSTLSMNIDVRSYPDRHNKVPIDFNVFTRIPSLRTIALKGFLFDDNFAQSLSVPSRNLNKPDIINMQNLPRRLETIKIMNLNMEKNDVKRLVLDNSKLKTLYLDNIGTSGNLGMTLDTLVSLLEKPDSSVDKIEIFDSFNRHSLENRDFDMMAANVAANTANANAMITPSKRNLRTSISRRGMNQGYKLIARILLKKESKPSFRAYRTANGDFEIIYEEDEDIEGKGPKKGMEYDEGPQQQKQQRYNENEYEQQVKYPPAHNIQQQQQHHDNHYQNQHPIINNHPQYQQQQQHQQKIQTPNYPKVIPHPNQMPHSYPTHQNQNQAHGQYQHQQHQQPYSSNNNNDRMPPSKYPGEITHFPVNNTQQHQYHPHPNSQQYPNHSNNPHPNSHPNPNLHPHPQQYQNHANHPYPNQNPNPNPTDMYYNGDLNSPLPSKYYSPVQDDRGQNKIYNLGGRRESKSIYQPSAPAPLSSSSRSNNNASRRKSSSSYGRRKSGRR